MHFKRFLLKIVVKLVVTIKLVAFISHKRPQFTRLCKLRFNKKKYIIFLTIEAIKNNYKNITN